MLQSVGVGLLLLSGCDVARNARNDLASLMGSSPPDSTVRKTAPAPLPQVTARGRAAPSPASPASSTTSAANTHIEPPATGDAAAAEIAPTAKNSPALELAGVSEDRLRAQLGAPISEKDHPPGKQWHYRDGKCTLDVQLYPDVRTKQFSTLAYKVKSDDDTDEGQRLCLAQLQSRLQARRKQRRGSTNSSRLRRGRR